jgi:hypothetical protein
VVKKDALLSSANIKKIKIKFYGARPGWNGNPTVIFTLSNPINVDELYDIRDLNYVRI